MQKKSIREIYEKNETRVVVVAAWPNRAKRQVHVLRASEMLCVFIEK